MCFRAMASCSCLDAREVARVERHQCSSVLCWREDNESLWSQHYREEQRGTSESERSSNETSDEQREITSERSLMIELEASWKKLLTAMKYSAVVSSCKLFAVFIVLYVYLTKIK